MSVELLCFTAAVISSLSVYFILVLRVYLKCLLEELQMFSHFCDKSAFNRNSSDGGDRDGCGLQYFVYQTKSIINI